MWGRITASVIGFSAIICIAGCAYVSTSVTAVNYVVEGSPNAPAAATRPPSTTGQGHPVLPLIVEPKNGTALNLTARKFRAVPVAFRIERKSRIMVRVTFNSGEQ
jgi:hypothetical protein